MNENDTNLIEHIEELRKVLIKSFLSIAVLTPMMFVFSSKILNTLIQFIIGNFKITLNYFSPVEVFFIQIKISVISALILAFPYIVKQVWEFVLPALHDNERKFIKSIAFVSTVLFLFGFCFCIFCIVPFIIKFGLSFSNTNINPMFGISNIINLVLCLSLIFGLMFQLPIVLFSLIKSGIVNIKTIEELRSYIIVGLLIIAGIFSPPEIISQLLLFIPTYCLFELTLLFCKK